MTDDELLQQLVKILSNHCGETGENEGAVETLNRIIENAEKWNELSDPMSNRSMEVVKNLSGEAGKNFKIAERLDKRIGEVTPSAPYNIRHSGLVWTPEVFSILKIELNKIKDDKTD